MRLLKFVKNIRVLLWLVLIALIVHWTPSFYSDNDKAALSVQLWSVRDKMQQDFTGTLQELAQLGFEGVEFAGDYGPYHDNPEGLKNYLQQLGLQASGAHVAIELLGDTARDKTLSFLKTLGVKYVIVPWDERAWHPQGVKELVVELSELTYLLKQQGLVLGFHNHDKELNTFADGTYWDYIASNTPDDMLLQMDVGWFNFAGKDPVEYLYRYPGRSQAMHFKIRTHGNDNKSPILGENGYDWGRLLNAAEAQADLKWIVIEQEEYPEGMDPLQAVAKSMAGLNQFLD